MSDALETVSNNPAIDPALQDKVKALHALAQTHYILDNGTYRYQLMQNLGSCLTFLQTLHAQLLEEALAHPDSDQFEQLRDIKKQKSEEKTKAEEQLK